MQLELQCNNDRSTKCCQGALEFNNLKETTRWVFIYPSYLFISILGHLETTCQRRIIKWWWKYRLVCHPLKFWPPTSPFTLTLFVAGSKIYIKLWGGFWGARWGVLVLNPTKLFYIWLFIIFGGLEAKKFCQKGSKGLVTPKIKKSLPFEPPKNSF